MNQDTICAIATASGGAIGTIRISGPNAIVITDKIFTSIKTNKKLIIQKGYSLTLGHISSDGKILDQVLVSIFHAPHSYTGEDCAEITCHGSAYILQQVILLLIQHGCRIAKPGEFTQRAFLNGKMDLSQAEAVADLIASSSAATHNIAMNQMRGGFTRELQKLRNKLLHITSLLELELDFSDHEDLEFADRAELKELAEQIEETLEKLTGSFKLGNVIKNGIPVAIVGETNAGKSTLLNALLNEEKAIVSEISGTTRDVIEDTLNLKGTLFRFIDTAGIRETSDTIENMGIARSFKKIDEASIILWVIDATNSQSLNESLKEQIISRAKKKQLIILFNKSDKLSAEKKDACKKTYLDLPGESLFISARERLNQNKLEELLVRYASLPEFNNEDVIITNSRHYEALAHALDAVKRVQQAMYDNLSGELISEDLRECIYHLSDIAGEVTSEDVLQNVFKKFCIGK